MIRLFSGCPEYMHGKSIGGFFSDSRKLGEIFYQFPNRFGIISHSDYFRIRSIYINPGIFIPPVSLLISPETISWDFINASFIAASIKS